MYSSSTALPHLLCPNAYFGAESYEREVSSLLARSWHVVTTTNQLAKSGDFVTTMLLNTPIQIRNFEGCIRAYSNVCAHRHCLLSSAPSGTSDRMRCQYHGWEYSDDGRSARIPEPKNFVPFDGDRPQLPEYRVATCGQLVFVNLSADAPSLEAFLGDFHEVVLNRFGVHWSPSLAWNVDYPANWKVPIENSLEAYHVPCIHPHTFKAMPSELSSQHLLLPHRTAFGTRLPFNPHSRLDAWFQSLEGWFVRLNGSRPTGEYWQHHVFPNLLFSFTDTISLCHCVLPTGPESCSGIVRQFGRTTNGVIRRFIAKTWGWLAGQITRRILVEDLGLFADIQRGLKSSPHPGILGRCEERIHSFQRFVQQQCHA